MQIYVRPSTHIISAMVGSTRLAWNILYEKEIQMNSQVLVWLYVWLLFTGSNQRSLAACGLLATCGLLTASSCEQVMPVTEVQDVRKNREFGKFALPGQPVAGTVDQQPTIRQIWQKDSGVEWAGRPKVYYGGAWQHQRSPQEREFVASSSPPLLLLLLLIDSFSSCYRLMKSTRKCVKTTG